MDCKSFHLTRKEARVLKKSLSAPVSESLAPRLIRLGLAQRQLEHNPGNMPAPTGKMVISDAGKDYLVYSQQQRRDVWLKNVLLPILVTIGTNIVIFAAGQLWPLILQWLGRFL